MLNNKKVAISGVKLNKIYKGGGVLVVCFLLLIAFAGTTYADPNFTIWPQNQHFSPNAKKCQTYGTSSNEICGWTNGYWGWNQGCYGGCRFTSSDLPYFVQLVTSSGSDCIKITGISGQRPTTDTDWTFHITVADGWGNTSTSTYGLDVDSASGSCTTGSTTTTTTATTTTITTTTTTTTRTTTTTTTTTRTTTSTSTTTTIKCPTGTSCANGFCSGSFTGCNTDCKKISIAKRALFDLLDDDDSGTINASDFDSLGVRIGFMRFYNGNDTSGDYSSGNIKLVTQISAMGATTSGTSYSLTFCGNSTSCASTVTSCTTGECIIGESVAGGTPLASALGEARTYLNAHKASDPCALCRNKFVIMVTDGNDTYACSGGGSECESYSYERRREVVARAKALKNAGYSVFVVGFGTSMPIYLQNTLNWAAYYGGTDNPSVANSGDVTAYNIPADGTSVYPTAVAAAGTAAGNCGSAGGATSACCTTSGNDVTDVCGGLTFYKSISNFASSANDPGFLNLSGYAFLASNSDELTAALKTAMNIIRESTYSFTTASVQSVRLNDTSNYENYLYEANFEPLSSDPFWIGHLKRYSIQTNGDIPTTSDWDAGVVLKNTDASARTIKTIVTSATLEDFLTTNSHLTDALLGVSSNTTCTGLCTSVINFIRGGDVNYGPSATDYAWKLGDVFHSSPVSVATPNINYVDTNDTSATKGFDAYRSSHIRTSSNKLRIIVVGANDGQLHAFRAGDLASSSSTTSGGSEAWSFIPPNQLYRLHYVNHTAHPDPELKRHKYFVDGPLSASEVWVGSGGTVGSTAKVSTDWRTYLVVAEGRGGMATLWSSQATCTSGFSASYSSTYPFYCGYYALDVTNTLSPQYVWKLGGNSYGLDDADGLYLGQAWSKLLLNRVRINSIERHVGFFGGGYSGAVSTGSGSAVTNTAGKGFFVLDSKTGEILWRFTRANDARMVYDLAGDAGLFDSDNDGFIDLAYIGDTGGNIWRFTFCKAKDGDTCDTSDWSGSLLFNNH